MAMSLKDRKRTVQSLSSRHTTLGVSYSRRDFAQTLSSVIAEEMGDRLGDRGRTRWHSQAVLARRILTLYSIA
ncbi:hypothetical protein CTA1_6534 [Colletotrichum tanaceti]|uniref:Uncharacterized protein n=1 Tax=Colletotrichum tanaceti TaxID=1306861 RepID=A0A4U6XRT4_9PEZI|nr:hypothetical protein CTA1_6534 [Colletotrichum tanaceti]